jgi:hypothetical protein
MTWGGDSERRSRSRAVSTVPNTGDLGERSTPATAEPLPLRVLPQRSKIPETPVRFTEPRSGDRWPARDPLRGHVRRGFNGAEVETSVTPGRHPRLRPRRAASTEPRSGDLGDHPGRTFGVRFQPAERGQFSTGADTRCL